MGISPPICPFGDIDGYDVWYKVDLEQYNRPGHPPLIFHDTAWVFGLYVDGDHAFYTYAIPPCG